MSSVWRKAESRTGYPYYVNADSGLEQIDHPELANLMGNHLQYAGIKYAAYRTAFKTYELQKKLEVASVRVSSGVLARHCLSISESSLTLEVCELEAVLADIYFAAAREGSFRGDADTAAQLLLNVLLNVFDPERNSPVRVQSVKTLLVLLSPEASEDKWVALVESCADHNGCVSARRLSTLLSQVARFAEYLGESDAFGEHRVQADVDRCFAKSAGMLGMSTRSVVAWALDASGGGGAHERWLAALDRVRASRSAAAPVAAGRLKLCSACGETLLQVLKFRCMKCCDVVVCERCYLYNKDLSVLLSGHKNTHTLQELIDGEPIAPECLGGFMKDFKRFFSCSKHFSEKRLRNRSKPPKKDNKKENDDSCLEKTGGCQVDTDSCKVNGGRKVFTSTVGKAAGVGASTPQALLQDIITQLESQNRVLKELSGQLEGGTNSSDDKLRRKVDTHWGQIATQINRLKILKDNLSTNCQDVRYVALKPTDKDRLQAFDLFSPIPVLQEEKPARATEQLRSQPRVLSLDSGNFSEASRPPDDSRLLAVSGDALRPLAAHATSDSISTVSMNDISTWFGNDGESTGDKARESGLSCGDGGRSNSLTVTERRFAADVRGVASSNHKMKELNADLDTVLDRLQQILTNNLVLDDSCFNNTQLRETASEMEGLLGNLIRGVEQRSARPRRPPHPPAAAAVSAV